MRDCLFGAETEYGLAAIDTKGLGVSQATVQNGVMRCALETIPHLPDLNVLRSPSLFLTNGGRLYLDCGFRVEYSTPEVTAPDELVRYCRAGDVIMERLAARLLASQPHWREIVCTRSNVDYVHRVSWGAHESYLMTGTGAPDTVRADLLPFLVSRVIFTGAGGFDASSVGLRFLLSPRVAFTSEIASQETMHDRPIFNTRDESLARDGYRRLHVICGESLCSDLGLLLRTGTTALVVRLVELGSLAGRQLALAHPLAALRTVASDPTCRRRLRLADGRRLTAIGIQRAYLAAIEASLAGPVPGAAGWPDWAPRICEEWRRVLDQLEDDPFALDDRLDWAAKWRVYTMQLARDGFEWTHLRRISAALDSLREAVGPVHKRLPWSSSLLERLAPELFATACRALSGWGIRTCDLDRFFECRARLFELDLRWGELSDRGVFRSLDRGGALAHRMAGCAGADVAADQPPARGRARLRGLHVTRLASSGPAVPAPPAGPGQEDHRRGARCSWDALVDHDGRRLDLGDPFERVERWTG